MRLAELQQALRAADPAAVLVPSRVLDRVIQAQHQLTGLFEKVPHNKSYVVDRPTLYRHVEQDELDLEPDRLLPPTVILLARPSPNTLGALADKDILLVYWRRLFHAAIHRALQRQMSEGRLTAEIIRTRIDDIGASGFAEIRMVLNQESYLLPNGGEPDETAVYMEFAAVYLELRYFAANLLPIYFPGLAGRGDIDALLQRDVDAAELFGRTRLTGAAEPELRTDTASDESHDFYWKLAGSADKAEQAGNTVRAAILRTRAARVAPAYLEDTTLDKAHADLRQLTRRLQAALELSDGEAEEWLQDLPDLLDKADQGEWPVEAALLYDLQQVGIDHERDIYALDVVTWLTSGGKRPIKRPLPSQRLVRIIKHLRSAAQRLTQARLHDEVRQHLARLLQTALSRCEERLRGRFRPVLADALLSVGLQAHNTPERAAFARMIEEMLDRIVDLGFLTFSDLRDTISRNQLKMPDLSGPHEFLRGDPLLRLDRRLATALDGVYRPGEVYLRWLEQLTAPAFGTVTGRWLTLFVLLPFGGAAVLLQGVQVLFKHLLGVDISGFDPASAIATLRGDRPTFPTLAAAFFAALGVFLLALLHVASFRRWCVQALVLTYRLLRELLFDLPLRLARLPAVRRLVNSWPFQLFGSMVLKPTVACLILWRVVPDAFNTLLGAIGIFAAISFALNTRMGRAAGEAVMQALEDLYEQLRAGLLPGLLRFLLWIFKRTIDLSEYVLHTVDEWLRFRQGDSDWSLVVRTIAGFLWYPVAFLVRFYLVVLIEPGFNPLKAPVSYLAAKFMVPLVGYLMHELNETLLTRDVSVTVKILSVVVAVPTLWLLPDLFGFLFWETKENWRLYRANREALLRPVGVGPHGETVRQLLQLGFHSGTVPKLYARLRQAEREGIRTGSWRSARTCRRALAEVELTIRRLVERELVKLLQESPRWKEQPLRVGGVTLTPARIGIDLAIAETMPLVRLEWEDSAGWLVASIREPGWLKTLSDEQQQAVTTALAGLYKLAGIDLVREQVREELPAAATRFTMEENDLVVWVGSRPESSIHYNLLTPKGPLKPYTAEGAAVVSWPALDPARLIFARVPLSWMQWVSSWDNGSDGHTPRTLFASPVKLLPAGSVG